jgi:hypothetical protein
MAIVPATIVGKIEFFRARNAPWTANATAIGTTAGAVTGVAAKVTAAQAKLDAQIALQNAVKAATEDLHLAIAELMSAGGDVIRQVRAKAATDGPTVYVLAQIPAPAAPSPRPAPGKPHSFAVRVREDGALILSWKSANPSNTTGTVYQVSRQIGTSEDGPFTVIGTSGRKEFVDATVPAGAAAVTYQVVAIRSTVAGLPAQFTVRLGVPGGAGGGAAAMTASVVSAHKLAA